MWLAFAPGWLITLHSLDCNELAHRGQHEKGPAGLALAVDVDAVVGLLFPDVLDGFMLAGSHAVIPPPYRILAFRDRRDPGGWVA